MPRKRTYSVHRHKPDGRKPKENVVFDDSVDAEDFRAGETFKACRDDVLLAVAAASEPLTSREIKFVIGDRYDEHLVAEAIASLAAREIEAFGVLWTKYRIREPQRASTFVVDSHKENEWAAYKRRAQAWTVAESFWTI